MAPKRALKPVALGRKNYLFVGSEGGGKSAAIAYTLIETRQAERRRSASLAHRRARPHRRPQDHPDRRAAPLALRCGRSVTGPTVKAPGRRSRTVSQGQTSSTVFRPLDVLQPQFRVVST